MQSAVILIALMICLTGLIGYYVYTRYYEAQNLVVLTVLHAGSLSGPFYELEKIYESTYPQVDVRREAAGSAATIRKVTDLHKIADVVGSADYLLIDTMMINTEPQYADWNLQFARNQLVIAFTARSKYNTEINDTNWIDILQRPKVIFGFSNPNHDPCGYRAVMMIQLAEIYYKRSDLFEALIQSHSDISCIPDAQVGNYTIYVPEDLNFDTGKILIRPKETDLIPLLETGNLDYLIIYRSIAYQHEGAGIMYISLPDNIDLSTMSYRAVYQKVKLVQYADKAEKRIIIRGEPIIYGITIPLNARHESLALDFVTMVITERGHSVLSAHGLTPIVPPTAAEESIGVLPDRLKPHVAGVHLHLA
jgi:molybdate/tungstate transport system substrate-binding protein